IGTDIHLSKPERRLERRAKQGNNWSFLSSDDEGGSRWKVQFRRLWVDDGRLLFLDPAAKTDIDVAVDSLAQGTDQTAPPIAVKGDGHWNGNPFNLRGTAESPLDLQDPQSPYRIDAHAQAGPTRAHARGTLLDPLRLADFDLQLALSGQDLEDLYPLLGVALPPSPPYELDGRLTRDIITGDSVGKS